MKSDFFGEGVAFRRQRASESENDKRRTNAYLSRSCHGAAATRNRAFPFRDGSIAFTAFSTTSVIIQITGEAVEKVKQKTRYREHRGDRRRPSSIYLSFLCDAVRPSLSLDLTPALPARAAALARSTSRWLPRDIGGKGRKAEAGGKKTAKKKRRRKCFSLLRSETCGALTLLSSFFRRTSTLLRSPPRLLGGSLTALCPHLHCLCSSSTRRLLHRSKCQGQ